MHHPPGSLHGPRDRPNAAHVAAGRKDRCDDPSQSISADQFKSVMRRFAASVNVITSVDGTVMNGMTATAVCSVSADPPSLLVIVNRSNRSHP